MKMNKHPILGGKLAPEKARKRFEKSVIMKDYQDLNFISFWSLYFRYLYYSEYDKKFLESCNIKF